MSQNKLNFYQQFLEFEAQESLINEKYTRLLEINERCYRIVDNMLEDSLNEKMIAMRDIKEALSVS